MARLARVMIFPIKSLDGVSVPQAKLLPSGALEFDRRWAIVDRAGTWVNGKRSPAVQTLRVEYDLPTESVLLRRPGDVAARRFHWTAERAGLEECLSEHLGQAVQLVENATHGWPDDTEWPGPTVISQATLDTVAEWFGGLASESVAARFRANLMLGDVEAFWEDRLAAEKGWVVELQIGSARLWGANPCQRCVVPTRDPQSAEEWPGFQRTFAERRRAALPAWATASRFDHFYRLAINTCVPPGAGPQEMAVGDAVEIIGVRPVA